MPGSWSSTWSPDPYSFGQPWSDPQLLALPAQVFRHVFVYVFEDAGGAGHVAVDQRAMAFGLFLGGQDLGFEPGLELVVLAVGPDAQAHQVLLEARDRVAQREVAPVVAGAVFGRIVGSRVRPGPVRDPFDQRGPQVAAGALGGPLRGRINGQEIIAVDAQRGDAAAPAPPREGGAFAPGKGPERRDG